MHEWPPRNVVVPVDFGAASGRACEVAAVVAALTGAKVTAFHAERIEAPPYFTHEQIETIEAEVRAARGRSEQHIREFAETRGLTPDAVRLTEIDAVDGILHEADHADLVVIGSHGRRGPSRWWIGSVSERVVRASPVPVLVVPSRGDGAAADLLRHVLVLQHGHDPGAAARAAERLAPGRVTVDRTSADGCDPVELGRATLVVVPLPGSPRARTIHEVAEVLSRRCTVPVLFVPGEPAR